jgi:hypothetical protein
MIFNKELNGADQASKQIKPSNVAGLSERSKLNSSSVIQKIPINILYPKVM